MDDTNDDRVRGQRLALLRSDAVVLEEALASVLYDRRARAAVREGIVADPLLAALDADELDEAAASVRRMVLERTHRGSGGLASWFPQTIAAWRAIHPDDASLDELLSQFCASTACSQWRELPAVDGGISLEEALYRFLVEANVGDAGTREDEFLSAIVRGLAITPRASFVWPSGVRRAPGGCFALTRNLVLHAAIDGRYLRGTVTALVAALLTETTATVARNVTARQLNEVTDALRKLRLVE